MKLIYPWNDFCKQTKQEKADISKLVQEKQTINSKDKQQLIQLLQKYESLFDGTLGCWNCKPVELELKDPNCKPIHSKPYPVLQSQEKKLKEEIDRLVQFGVLRKVNQSEWASPAFTISKPDGLLRSLTDNRAINKLLKNTLIHCQKYKISFKNLKAFNGLPPWT